MSPTFVLLLSLTIAQTDSATAPRVSRGQELVYRGQFVEETHGGAAPIQRAYDLESRVFVHDVNQRATEVAVFTVLRPASVAADHPGSARLELASVDRRGRVTLQSTATVPRVSLEGPNPLEPAAFVETPAEAFAIGMTWDVADRLRPPREWRVDETEFVHGVRCWRLVGAQQSAEWDRPTASAPSWRRSDVVWLSAQSGIVVRLRRTIERRTGGDGSPGFVATTEFELVEDIVYPDKLAADRRREIQQAAYFSQSLAELKSRPARAGSQPLAALSDRIDHYLAKQPATPYRPALLSLRQRVAAELRGEAPPNEPPDPSSKPPAVGDVAPDFLANDLVHGSPVRLARWRDRPTVLLFVRPDSSAAAATLQVASELRQTHGQALHVAVMVVGNEDQPRPAWVQYGVPLLAGRDAAAVFGVRGAALCAVIDADGFIRHLSENPAAVNSAVRTLVK